MNPQSTPLHVLAQMHGVHIDFHDLHGGHHPASPDTLRALLAALGVEAGSEKQISEALDQTHATRAARFLPDEIVAQAGDSISVPVVTPGSWVLTDEAGAIIAEGRAKVAVKLKAPRIGYYHLGFTANGQTEQARLLVRPARAPDLTTRTGRDRVWGITAALYGLRSDRNGGLGNYADLGQACAAFGASGAQFLGINPIHALGWAADDMISPYSPTHRGFFNTDHIASDADLGPTPDADLIDYAAFRAQHRAALRAEFVSFQNTDAAAEFAQWYAAQDGALRAFTQFEALSERHGPDFRDWPAALKQPGTQASKDAAGRQVFHGWLQWRAQTQVTDAQVSARDAGMSLGLYLDLAVGPRPGGAEVWMNANTIAKGVTIGAPPDHLSPKGQSWALAAHAPGPLSAAFYAPLRAMLRQLMSRCGLLRIDHALGLLRSFWLPDDGSPGGYVTQPFDALLAVIAIEAERAGCVIVGEDLGLVPEGFREKLNGSGLYSYAVWQYEADHQGHLRAPETLPASSLACFGTHDTPTLQGFWYGLDIDWWQRVGWLESQSANARHAARAQQRQSLRDMCAIAPDANAPEISAAVNRRLAQAPSALLAVQLDDALRLIEAQNLPGTIDAHPNWRRRTPVPVAALENVPELRSMDVTMPPSRRSRPADITPR